MGQLDTKDARTIARKLGMERDAGKSKAHDFYVAKYQGIVIASFGIRRGSRRSLGHGYICGELSLTPRKAKELAWCTFSKQDWLDHMREQGNLPHEES
jgi:hypothetical protein